MHRHMRSICSGDEEWVDTLLLDRCGFTTPATNVDSIWCYQLDFQQVLLLSRSRCFQTLNHIQKLAMGTIWLLDITFTCAFHLSKISAFDLLSVIGNGHENALVHYSQRATADCLYTC
jgi:hypothetical protein